MLTSPVVHKLNHNSIYRYFEFTTGWRMNSSIFARWRVQHDGQWCANEPDWLNGLISKFILRDPSTMKINLFISSSKNFSGSEWKLFCFIEINSLRTPFQPMFWRSQNERWTFLILRPQQELLINFYCQTVSFARSRIRIDKFSYKARSRIRILTNQEQLAVENESLWLH